MKYALPSMVALGVMLMVALHPSAAPLFYSPVSAGQESAGLVVVLVVVPVERVVDGDTVRVDLNGDLSTIRLIGMDTPEVVDPRKPVQCYGREASAHAHELLDGQWVALEFDGSQGERDKYGRLLAYVWLPDGRNFAQVMISEGYAHEYTYRRPYKYTTAFKDAERQARTSSVGLWSFCAGNS